MAVPSVLIPSISLEPIHIPSTFSYASTLVTATRAAAAVGLPVSAASSTAAAATPITSDFVLTATAGATSRTTVTDSSSTIAMAVIVPLIALLALISVIVFRMYRTRKEREEAAAAEAARAKTRAIEQQISDMESISEKFNLEKYRISPEVRDLGARKEDNMPLDIPIELEADEPDKRRYHGL